MSELREWNYQERGLVFVLSLSSIVALLVEFYNLCSMQKFTWFVSIPCCVLLLIIAGVDRVRNRGILYRNIMIGLLAGFVAAVAYDLYRLPFVYAKQWHLDGFLPQMKLFKVFPAFGALILGQTALADTYSLKAHLIGWAYHFSNGMTFSTMYLAMIGDPRRHTWAWGIVMAMGLEMAMLLTPYTQLFQIPLTFNFIWITLTAHCIFGVVMGLCCRALYARSHK